MANDINRVILIGRLTKDPELRHTINGSSSVVSFSLASNHVYATAGERKENTSFFGCIAWGKLGEAIAQYCKKGQRVGLEGRLQQRTWDDQSGNKRSTVEVVVETFQFLSPKQDSGSQASGPEVPEGNPFSDDSIQF